MNVDVTKPSEDWRSRGYFVTADLLEIGDDADMVVATKAQSGQMDRMRVGGDAIVQPNPSSSIYRRTFGK